MSMNKTIAHAEVAKHEALSDGDWHKFKENWLIAIAATPKVPPVVLKLAAVFLAEVGNKTHEHSGKRYTRGVVKVSVGATLERLGMDDTDSTRRQIRRAKTWLRENGFIADYLHAVGGGGRRRRAASYALTLPNGGSEMSSSNEEGHRSPPSAYGGSEESSSNEEGLTCPPSDQWGVADVPHQGSYGGSEMSAYRGSEMSPSFDYGARTVSNTTTCSNESARTHARGALTASEVRKREQETPGELWRLAETHGRKPNPSLNMWVRHVGADTPVDDPLGSFRAYLESVSPLAA